MSAHEIEGVVIVLLAVGLPIYWGIRYGRRHDEEPVFGDLTREVALGYASRPTVPVASPVEIIEVPIETVPPHVGQNRPTLYVAR